MADDTSHNKQLVKKTAAPKKRTARQDTKGKATRLRLLRAAAKVIAKHGYPGCTISRVTAEAKIAHGTFYFHFPSQQAMFDEILPSLGEEMLHEAAEALKGIDGFLELERRGVEFIFDHVTKYPYMYRLLTESEAHAPVAFHRQMNSMLNAYVKSLTRSLHAEEITGYDEDEMLVLATILLGARTYLMMKCRYDKSKDSDYFSSMTATYLKFIKYGVNAK